LPDWPLRPLGAAPRPPKFGCAPRPPAADAVVGAVAGVAAAGCPCCAGAGAGAGVGGSGCRGASVIGMFNVCAQDPSVATVTACSTRENPVSSAEIVY